MTFPHSSREKGDLQGKLVCGSKEGGWSTGYRTQHQTYLGF